jgi:hypothetical protein
MKRSTWLRISAIVTLLYALTHTMGFPWTPVRDGGAQGVIDAMRSVRVVVEGTSRTYWDFYEGFGFAIAGFLAVQAVILWQLASLARSMHPAIRGIIAAFLVAFIFNAAVVGRYFFAAPVIFDITLVVCLGIALFGRAEGAAPTAG